MKRILRHFRLFPVRLMVFALVSGIAMSMFGCMGGGGGGTASPGPDEQSRVAERVRSILLALETGDTATLAVFRRSAQSGFISGGGTFLPLFVHDLGEDIDNPADNATHTFYFNPDEIVYPTPTQAMATAWTWYSDGGKLNLRLWLEKEPDQWYLTEIELAAVDPLQAAGSAGPLPSNVLWPMARDNRWQFVEIEAEPGASTRPRGASRVNAMVLNATRAVFRNLVISADPALETGNRQIFRLELSAYESGVSTSGLELPVDPGTFEFGRFSNGASAVDRGFFTIPAGAMSGPSLWEILDPSRQGFVRAFEDSGLYLEGADTGFNEGRPWRLTDMLVQEGVAATQAVTLALPGSPTRTGEARILVMESVPVTLPWVQGLARRFDIAMTWNGSADVTWTSLFFLPGMGLIGYAEYDFATRHPVHFAWLWGASVGSREFLPPGDTGSLDPFVALALDPAGPFAWTVGTSFTHAMTASGGQEPYAWSLSGAPAGVSIEAATGLLSGIPTEAGSFTFDVAVRDAADRAVTLPVQASIASAGPSVSVTLEQAATQSDPSNASAIHFTVVFAEPVTGFTPEDVILGGTAEPATCTVVETAPNDGTTYDLAVSGMSGEGTVTAAIPEYGANSLYNVPNRSSTSIDNQVTRDMTPPTAVLSLHPAQVDPASLTPILFRLTFSEPVIGFASSNIVLPSGEQLASAGTTDPAGLAYEIAVDFGGTGGAVSLSVDPAGITDEAGNALSPVTVIDDTVDFDASFPYVSIEQAPSQPDPASGTTVSFQVRFSEPVSGFTAADVSLGGTAQPATCVIAQVDAANYLVSVSGMAGDGTVIASIPAGIAVDALGNGNAPSFLQPTDNEVTLDNTAPEVIVTQATGQNGWTNSEIVTYYVTFSEPVTGFDDPSTDIEWGEPPMDAPPGWPTITAISPTTYTVELNSPIDGEYSLYVLEAAAADLAGNTSLGAPESVAQIRDTLPPTATISTYPTQASIASSSPVQFRLLLTESSQEDWATRLSNAGTLAVANWGYETSDLNLKLFTIGAFNLNGSGTILPALNTTGITDQAGNQMVVNVTAATVAFDNVAPTVTPLEAFGTDFVVVSGSPADLVFSETLDATSRTAVTTALENSRTGGNPATYVWTDNVLTIYGDAALDSRWGTSVAVNNVSDLVGNTASSLLLIGIVTP